MNRHETPEPAPALALALESRAPTPLPVRCVLDTQQRLFLVTRSKGKTLASGGFGIAVANTTNTNTAASTAQPLPAKSAVVTVPVDAKSLLLEHIGANTHATTITTATKTNDTTTATTTTTTTTQLYLFIEEVIYLHERGMLECYEPREGSGGDDFHATNDAVGVLMDSYRLYSLLDVCGVSLATYLVYAYLAKQDFRVMRHDSTRRPILEAMQEQYAKLLLTVSTSAPAAVVGVVGDKGDDKDNEEEATAAVHKTLKKDPELQALRARLRLAAATAAPPAMIAAPNTAAPASIAFDCYKPNSAFRKSAPGLPDFYVAATHYSTAKLSFRQIQQLLHQADGLPLKIATVSDSGVVIMFGITDYGVPNINP
jgi:hypothetical protein